MRRRPRSVILLAFTSLASSTLSVPRAYAQADPNATVVNLAPRQSGISPLQCTLQLSFVQCCQTFQPLSAVASVVEPILNDLGIPLPGLGTLLAFNCQDTVLGLGCGASTLCCTLVVPNQNIGVDCVPVDPLL